MIRIIKVPLRRDVPFAEWVHHMNHTYRHVYNRAAVTRLGIRVRRPTMDISTLLLWVVMTDICRSTASDV